MGFSDGLVLSYYGDDFTGSTDVMEALTFAGVPTVLFMTPPTTEQIAQFEGVEAVGVAGRTRSMSPETMAQELQPVFACFRALKTPVVHYKTCSTFDSSPEIGSIGKAIDVGQAAFGSSFVPLVVGAPILRRYCVFGNLFAKSGLDSDVFRLDRHPTMRHHPITPMEESDLRVHLSRQTEKQIALFDVLQLSGNRVQEAFDVLMQTRPDVVLFDTLNDRDLAPIGEAIWRKAAKDAPLFVAGSSGAEYALAAHWREKGWIPELPERPRADGVDQLVAVSGSCSPVTADQIDRAVSRGFSEIALDTLRLIDSETAEGEIDRGVRMGLEEIETGRSVILHTGRGPGDDRIERTVDRFKAKGFSDLDVKLKSGAILGEALGRILKGILESKSLKRVATTGGDTSYYVARALGIEALEVVASMAPGSPLCRVVAQPPQVNGVEMTFKGGQVGKVGFFEQVLNGF